MKRACDARHPARRFQGHLQRAALLGLAIAAAGCDLRDRDPKFLLEQKPVAEVRHMGYRQDIAAERRGNAVFRRARFTREGDYLVTDGDGFRVFDATTGALRLTIPAGLDPNEAFVVDGRHHQLLARGRATSMQDTLGFGLRFWDLRDGTARGLIPDVKDARPHPVGFTAAGEAVVIRGGNVEVWSPDSSAPRLTIPPPAMRAYCDWGRPSHVTYNDKECFELSPSGRLLAVVVRRPDDHNSPPMPFVLDLEPGLEVGVVRQVNPPTDEGRGGVRGFAFSSDERIIAMGLSTGVWFFRRDRDADPMARDHGPFIRGEHQRNEFLTPMAFTANDTRLVTLGDQLQVSTFDVETGALVGRVAPPFEDWEGALRVSADGQRAVAYRFVSDLLVVIDGARGALQGYVCPFFCNRKHAPVEVPFAVSPDGRRIATGGRMGAGIWDADADTLIAPLRDPALPPLRER